MHVTVDDCPSFGFLLRVVESLTSFVTCGPPFNGAVCMSVVLVHWLQIHPLPPTPQLPDPCMRLRASTGTVRLEHMILTLPFYV